MELGYLLGFGIFWLCVKLYEKLKPPYPPLNLTDADFKAISNLKTQKQKRAYIDMLGRAALKREREAKRMAQFKAVKIIDKKEDEE